jgi:hypothetical protein
VFALIMVVLVAVVVVAVVVEVVGRASSGGGGGGNRNKSKSSGGGGGRDGRAGGRASSGGGGGGGTSSSSGGCGGGCSGGGGTRSSGGGGGGVPAQNCHACAHTRTHTPRLRTRSTQVLDNCIDEVQGGHASRVDVEIDVGSGWVTIRDDGRGIPTGVHPRTGAHCAALLPGCLSAALTCACACGVRRQVGPRDRAGRAPRGQQV